eukprot:scaffold45463_cov14-Tisochrysis_lutea.AAC.1
MTSIVDVNRLARVDSGTLIASAGISDAKALISRRCGTARMAAATRPRWSEGAAAGRAKLLIVLKSITKSVVKSNGTRQGRGGWGKR